MKISVLGCGRWGSFIGWYVATHGHDVYQWGIEGDYTFDILKNEGKNEYVELDKWWNDQIKEWRERAKEKKR